MNILEQLKAEQDKSAKLDAQVKALEAKLAAIPDTKDAIAGAVKAAVDPLQAQLAEANTKLAKADEDLKKAKADAVAADERAKKDEADIEKKISARVLETVQKCGIDPAALSTNSNPSGDTNSEAALWKQYKAITDDAEKRAFYVKHRAVLNPFKR